MRLIYSPVRAEAASSRLIITSQRHVGFEPSRKKNTWKEMWFTSTESSAITGERRQHRPRHPAADHEAERTVQSQEKVKLATYCSCFIYKHSRSSANSLRSGAFFSGMINRGQSVYWWGRFSPISKSKFSSFRSQILQVHFFRGIFRFFLVSYISFVNTIFHPWSLKRTQRKTHYIWWIMVVFSQWSSYCKVAVLGVRWWGHTEAITPSRLR